MDYFVHENLCQSNAGQCYVKIAISTNVIGINHSKSHLFTFLTPPKLAAIFSTLIQAYITYVDSPANS